jgi:putative restriction endonuclease
MMNDKIKKLSYYINTFQKLRRDYKKGGAPHKPILLLSIIQAYENKLITTNKIYITPELVGFFKSNWAALVRTDHDLKFALPFYHMNSEPFWKIFPNAGCEKWISSKGSMRSFNNLNTAVAYAEIDSELFKILKEKETREILRQTLLDKYFPETKGSYTSHNEHDYLNNLTSEILEEESAEYRKHVQELKKKLDEENYQEEIYLRGGIFKREIPKIYNNTCCISGFRVDAIINISMIDACHIIPFSESYDDTIKNGIALCPNLHRAFDRGLIAIDDNYRVVVSKKFVESKSSYSLRQLEGKMILLPTEGKFYPSIEYFYQHRKYHQDNLS